MANAATGVPSTSASTTAPGDPSDTELKANTSADRHQRPGVGPEPEQRHGVGQARVRSMAALDRPACAGPTVAGDRQVGVGQLGAHPGERLDQQVLCLLGHEAGDVRRTAARPRAPRTARGRRPSDVAAEIDADATRDRGATSQGRPMAVQFVARA